MAVRPGISCYTAVPEILVRLIVYKLSSSDSVLMHDIASHSQTNPSAKDQKMMMTEVANDFFFFPLESNGTSLRDFLSIQKLQDFL